MATLPWLEEVKADAERITLKRIRDNQDDAAYEASKLQPRAEAPATKKAAKAEPKAEAPADSEAEEKGK